MTVIVLSVLVWAMVVAVTVVSMAVSVAVVVTVVAVLVSLCSVEVGSTDAVDATVVADVLSPVEAVVNVVLAVLGPVEVEKVLVRTVKLLVKLVLWV